ncbi:hypothetical protein B0O99DRAFT_624435 [Bisporella sp. PMI_857]|nr:hypothetical protein B0O99DRAFT_624435 [Bisporella sp. PMI_857]
MIIPRSLIFNRTYATAANRPSRLGKTIGLDHFLQRAKALALWRSIVRGCRRIDDPRKREETLGYAREEFKRNKTVEDISQIRYLISTGKTQWDTWERYIDGL